MIHVDSPEPTVLAFTLTVAPPEPPPAVPMPAPLVLCGPGVHTLATTLAARYPEIYEVASVEPKPEDPKPEGDGEAKDEETEETPEGEEPAEPEAAETQADAEEQAADADAPPTEPYVPEKYPGAKSAKAIQRQRYLRRGLPRPRGRGGVQSGQRAAAARARRRGQPDRGGTRGGRRR